MLWHRICLTIIEISKEIPMMNSMVTELMLITSLIILMIILDRILRIKEWDHKEHICKNQ
jgi:hypothetical protein